MGLNGKVTDADGNSLGTHIIILNSTSAESKIVNDKGIFSMNIRQNDTLLFIAMGYNEKVVCMRDSAFKLWYNINVKLESLPDEIGKYADTIVETEHDTSVIYTRYVFVVNYLYAYIRRFDTLNMIKTIPISITEKYNAMKTIMGTYINSSFKTMRFPDFIDFMARVLVMERYELWTKQVKLLMADVVQLYRYYNSPDTTENNTHYNEGNYTSVEYYYHSSGSSSSSTPKCKGYGCGVLLIYYLVKGLSSGGG